MTGEECGTELWQTMCKWIHKQDLTTTQAGNAQSKTHRTQTATSSQRLVAESESAQETNDSSTELQCFDKTIQTILMLSHI